MRQFNLQNQRPVIDNQAEVLKRRSDEWFRETYFNKGNIFKRILDAARDDNYSIFVINLNPADFEKDIFQVIELINFFIVSQHWKSANEIIAYFWRKQYIYGYNPPQLTEEERIYLGQCAINAIKVKQKKIAINILDLTLNPIIVRSENQEFLNHADTRFYLSELLYEALDGDFKIAARRLWRLNPEIDTPHRFPEPIVHTALSRNDYRILTDILNKFPGEIVRKNSQGKTLYEAGRGQHHWNDGDLKNTFDTALERHKQQQLAEAIRKNDPPNSNDFAAYLFKAFDLDGCAGYTPIMYAASLGRWEWVRAIAQFTIAQFNTDKDDKGKFGSALIIVVQTDSSKIDPNTKNDLINLLLRSAENFNYINPKNGWNIMHYFVFLNDIEKIKWLFEHRSLEASLLSKTTNKDKQTPYQLAIAKRFYDCAKSFLSPEEGEQLQMLSGVYPVERILSIGVAVLYTRHIKKIETDLTIKIEELSKDIGPEENDPSFFDSVWGKFTNRETKKEKKCVLQAALNLVQQRLNGEATQSDRQKLRDAVIKNPNFAAGLFKNDTGKLVNDVENAFKFTSYNR